MKKVIFIGGLYNILFAIFHLTFWKMFDWDSELSKLSIMNSGVLQILNIQTIYYFIFTAMICFVFPDKLQSTKPGKWFLGGLAGFWIVRAILQLVFYWVDSPLVFVGPIIFLLGAIIFLIPVFYKKEMERF